ncbi:GNAT family N-acetyltransferase [Flavobacterium sp. UMI-01]|uniref:GNAT family N-acetyltransferase n=1 Tax=Flavobacterium sp. UMI-01 TaxID=1441053 RepID=UPI001C7D3CBA|nr:GNAT family N-acetyltransferase [Flavobacterium sp. UMI-01]GIZ08992.1 N-acetyltransferase [Flavobacterium sp. UMI-01]
MDVTTQIDKNKHNGAFEINNNGKTVAQMTFRFSGATKIIILHTEVDSEYKGQGLGKLLLSNAIAFAQESALKILPLCPFAKAYFDKHPEWNSIVFTN